MIQRTSYVSADLQSRINEREQLKANVTTEQAMAMEKKVAMAWEQEANKYENINLDKTQLQVLAATRDFYNSIKKSLTMKNKYDISLRRTGSYTGAHFPHSLKDNKTAVAWLKKVGDNQGELERLFPNQKYDNIKPIEVKREPVIKVDGEIFEEKMSYVPVLTTLAYLLQCEEWGCDEIISIKSSKPVIRNMKQILAETTFYTIDIVYDGDFKKPYSYIKVSPKANSFRLRNKLSKQ